MSRKRFLPTGLYLKTSLTLVFITFCSTATGSPQLSRSCSAVMPCQMVSVISACTTFSSPYLAISRA